MADPVAELSETADAAGRETVRIPANIMGLLRQSYDSREKVLDWLLAIMVALLLCWVFRDDLMGLVPQAGPNAGREPQASPNQNVRGVTPFGIAGVGLYTYNLPRSRAMRYSIDRSAVPPPSDPSQPPGSPIQ